MHRRKQVRIPLIHHFEVRNLASDEVVGYLANITSRGMMLLAERPSDPDPRRLLPLLLIIRDLTGTHPISLTARRTWARPDEASGLHAMGLEFQGVSEATTATLKNLIREFGCAFGRMPPHLRRTRRLVLQE